MANAKNGVDSAQLDIQQQDDHILKSTGDIERADVVLEANREIDNSYFDELAFMEEEVDVVVSESTDPNAEPVVSVFNNGISQYFVRGKMQTVKRKFVEVLARAKQTTLNTIEENNEVRIKRQTSLRYPFQVMRDSNPKGMAWLRNIINEPG